MYISDPVHFHNWNCCWSTHFPYNTHTYKHIHFGANEKHIRSAAIPDNGAITILGYNNCFFHMIEIRRPKTAIPQLAGRYYPKRPTDKNRTAYSASTPQNWGNELSFRTELKSARKKAGRQAGRQADDSPLDEDCREEARLSTSSMSMKMRAFGSEQSSLIFSNMRVTSLPLSENQREKRLWLLISTSWLYRYLLHSLIDSLWARAWHRLVLPVPTHNS